MVRRSEPLVGDRFRVDNGRAGVAEALQTYFMPAGRSGAHRVGADRDFIAVSEKVMGRLAHADVGLDADEDRLFSRKRFEALHKRSATSAGKRHFRIGVLDDRVEAWVGPSHAVGVLDRRQSRNTENLSDLQKELGSPDNLIGLVDRFEKAWLQIHDDQNGF